MNLFEDFLYRIERISQDSSEERVILTQYVGENQQVIMPSVIRDLPVTALDHSIFADNPTIKSVILPENLEEIGNFTFSFCKSLEKIEFPPTVKSMGKRCFQHCVRLEEVIFPEGLTTLKRECFRQCSSLKRVYLPKSLTLLEDCIFEDCASLETVDTHPAFVFRDRTHFTGCHRFINAQGVVVVNRKYMSYYGDFPEVTIPEGVEIIPLFCFSKKTNLKTVHFPQSLLKIQGNAFDGCENLEEVHLPPRLKELELATFHQCTSLKKVVLSEDLESIHSSCFRKCSNLTEVHWNQKLRSIGENTFTNTKLSRLPALPSLEVIERNAFGACIHLKEVFFHENLKELGQSSFLLCISLEVIHFAHSYTALKTLLTHRGDSTKKIFQYNEKIRHAPALVASGWAKTHQNQFHLNQFLHWTELSPEEQDYFFQNWSGNTEDDPVVDMIFLEGCVTEMSQYLELGFHLTLFQLEEYLSRHIAQQNPAATAILLEYQENHYTREEIAEYQTNRDFVEMGLESPTLAQLQRKWYVDVSPHYIRLRGYKEEDKEAFIPEETAEGLPIKYVKYDIFTQESEFLPLERVTFSTDENIILGADMNQSNLKTLEIPPHVQVLHRFPFSEMEHLEEVFIPSSVVEIHKFAFLGCPNLTSVYFEDEITVPPFQDCPKLTFFGVKGGRNFLE